MAILVSHWFWRICKTSFCFSLHSFGLLLLCKLVRFILTISLAFFRSLTAGNCLCSAIHDLLITRPYMSHLKAKINWLVFQRNATKEKWTESCLNCCLNLRARVSVIFQCQITFTTILKTFQY